MIHRVGMSVQRFAGAFFTIFTTILVFLDYRYGGTKQTSEQVRP
jgi:hypothetical protein